jgi:hypothetical protein
MSRIRTIKPDLGAALTFQTLKLCFAVHQFCANFGSVVLSSRRDETKGSLKHCNLRGLRSLDPPAAEAFKDNGNLVFAGQLPVRRVVSGLKEDAATKRALDFFKDGGVNSVDPYSNPRRVAGEVPPFSIEGSQIKATFAPKESPKFRNPYLIIQHDSIIPGGRIDVPH